MPLRVNPRRWSLVALVILTVGCQPEAMPVEQPDLDEALLAHVADGVSQAESLVVMAQLADLGVATLAETDAPGFCTLSWFAPQQVSGCSDPVPAVAPPVPWVAHSGQARDPGEIEQRDPISIKFAGTVQSVFLSSSGALKCTGSLGRLIGYRNGAEVAQAANVLINPADCGADDVTFGVRGELPASVAIDSLVIEGVDPWVFPVLGTCCGRALLRYIIQYRMATGERCEVAVTPYAQDDDRWADEIYDHTSLTIGRKGCALTALAMALTFAGHTVLPDSLNAFMNANEGFGRVADVLWDVTTQRFSNSLSRWTDLERSEDRTRLAAEVCSDRDARGTPVVVRVPSRTTRDENGRPGPHFVLVTGAPREATETTSLSEFRIVDPNPNTGATTLADYGTFELRGFGALRGGLTLSIVAQGVGAQVTEAEQPRRLTISGAGGAILVTDVQGRRLGQAVPEGPVLGEIPDGLYYDHEEPDDAQSAVMTSPQVSRAVLPGAPPGTYRVQLIATATVGGELRTAAELPDFTWVVYAVPLAVTQGEVYAFEIQYDPASTAPPAVTRVVTARLTDDTYLRSGNPNTNEGTALVLRVRPTGDNRALVRFDGSDLVTAVGSGTLVSALLELTIVDNADNWGPGGRTIDAHRLTQAWTELGATWNCALDTDPGNPVPDCPAEAWEMGATGPHPWVTPATATVLLTNGLRGVVTFDVTADAVAFLAGAAANYGWLLKRTNEGPSGSVDFGSRESGAVPRLVLRVQR